MLWRDGGLIHEISKAVAVRVDRGYEGLEQAYPELKVAKPIRARRNHSLSVLGQVYNQLMRRLRIGVEPVLAHLERFCLLAGIYRGRMEDYDENFLVISGLHNFRKTGSLSW